MPLVIDTDLGGDDEHDGRRARLARHLLDALGRPAVPVVGGRDLGNTRYWAADDLTPGHVSDITFSPANGLIRESAEYQALADAASTTWAGALLAHLDQWFTGFHPGSMQHDALALTAAMGLPFLDSGLTGVGLDPIGRMQPGEDAVFLARRADYPAFRHWLAIRLPPPQDSSLATARVGQRAKCAQDSPIGHTGPYGRGGLVAGATGLPLKRSTSITLQGHPGP